MIDYTQQQQQAKELYTSSGYTQKQIANAVGVTEKTIYRWMKKEEWDGLKKQSFAAPAVMVNHLYSEVIELQNHIASREEGKRFPTHQESEIIRKLITCIDKLGIAHSQDTNKQIFMNFATYMLKSDNDFSKKLVDYAETYLWHYNNFGYKPYEFLHGVEVPVADPDLIKDVQEALGEKAPEVVTNTPAPSTVKEDEKTNTPTNNCQPANSTSVKPAKHKKLKTWAKLGNEFPPSLHDGKILWQGNGEVLDYNQHCYRKMTIDEAEAFRDLGFDVEWEENNTPEKLREYQSLPTIGLKTGQDNPTSRSTETPTQKASTPPQPSNIPCPVPDTIRQLSAKPSSEIEHVIPEELKNTWPHIPLLPGGVKWLGRGMVYDAKLKRKREIQFGELDQLRKLGFDRHKLQY
ncbi:MAG: helix-turn-helix domain-containing protein [Flavipsychrobacter sp.]|nr:helix-turn-helix domain-containing protein [Flavipsychrobacter sp.]